MRDYQRNILDRENTEPELRRKFVKEIAAERKRILDVFVTQGFDAFIKEIFPNQNGGVRPELDSPRYFAINDVKSAEGTIQSEILARQHEGIRTIAPAYHRLMLEILMDLVHDKDTGQRKIVDNNWKPVHDAVAKLFDEGFGNRVPDTTWADHALATKTDRSRT